MNKFKKEELKQRIGEAVGHASMCWTPRPGNQVFDSTEASKVVDDLYEYINKLIMEESR